MTDTARRMLLGIFVLGLVGISVELWLLGHDEDLKQLIPLILAAMAAVAVVAVLVRPGRGFVRGFQLMMLLFVLSGGVGSALHFQVNMEFQLEMDPSLEGLPLFRKAIRAKVPPALAPGAMIQLGLIGLAYTYRHPSLGATT